MNTPTPHSDRSPTLLDRDSFREQVFEREDNTCLVPWCDTPAVDAHHIIEREQWDNGGYYLPNGAALCETHHRHAERSLIPPQALWRWLGVEPMTPAELPTNINKWGDEGVERGETFKTPNQPAHKSYIKYPSTRHLPFSHITDDDDTAHGSVEPFIDIPLTITVKIDGSNTILVKDTDEPVRGRNGSHADKPHFDRLKQTYWQRGLYDIIPEHLQIVGEWAYEKHSIHYGCNGCCPERDRGPELTDHYLVFGVFDTRYNVWLSWPQVEQWARRLRFPTVPVARSTLDASTYENTNQLYSDLVDTAELVVNDGHEGIVVRSTYPMHYGQFSQYMGKYVRDEHQLNLGESWPPRNNPTNNTNGPE